MVRVNEHKNAFNTSMFCKVLNKYKSEEKMCERRKDFLCLVNEEKKKEAKKKRNFI